MHIYALFPSSLGHSPEDSASPVLRSGQRGAGAAVKNSRGNNDDFSSVCSCC